MTTFFSTTAYPCIKIFIVSCREYGRRLAFQLLSLTWKTVWCCWFICVVHLGGQMNSWRSEVSLTARYRKSRLSRPNLLEVCNVTERKCILKQRIKVGRQRLVKNNFFQNFWEETFVNIRRWLVFISWRNTKCIMKWVWDPNSLHKALLKKEIHSALQSGLGPKLCGQTPIHNELRTSLVCARFFLMSRSQV